MTALPPFSQRFGFAKAGVICSDFPSSARVGLLHLLERLVDKNYVDREWIGLRAELARLARTPPGDKATANDLLSTLPWDRVFTFIERIHATLLREVHTYDGDLVARLSDVQAFFGAEVNQLFGEEGIGYEFRDGVVVRPGRPQTQKALNRAAHVLASRELKKAKAHFTKATQYFGQAPHPDLENVVKEAVAAIEAAAKALFPGPGKDLEAILRSVQGVDERHIPPTLVKAIMALYAFRGAGDGVAHGAATGGVVTSPVAEWVLSQAAAHITYLADFSSILDDEVLF